MRISGAVTVEIAGINSEHTEAVGLKQVALVLTERQVHARWSVRFFFSYIP